MENCENCNVSRLSGSFAGAVREIVGFVRKELIFRGILFLILGLLMLFKPGQTLYVITVTIGVLILIDAVAMLFPALTYRGKGKILLILNALFFILLGLFTCTAPLAMNVIWVVMIGFWQFFSGIQWLAFRSSAGISAIVSGTCGIIAGLFLIFMPVLGLLTLTWIMGIISFVSGLAAIFLGIRLKKAMN